MKTFFIALVLVTITFISGQAAKALFMGESFPVPVSKTVTVTMPSSVPSLP